MDVAVIGLKAHSETIKEATKDLKGMSSASKQAEAANKSRERSDIAAAGAAKANAMAVNALASASKAAAFRQRQLAVQSLDVAQSLALGMPPMMVAIQQGGQLAGIYAGQGGIKGAFKEATASVMRYVRANPLLVAAGAASAAVFAGLTYEINKTTDVSVGFGDVFMATMSVAADGIKSVFKPAVDAIAPFVQAAWDASIQYTKTRMNTMIGVAVGAYKYIMAEWSNMPAAFADISIKSANALIAWAKYGANEVIGIYGDMLAKINSIVGTSFARPGIIKDDLSIPNPFAGASKSTAGVDAFRDAMNFDYLGATFDNIRDKAIELAIAGEEAGKKLAKGAKKAIDPWKDLRKVNDAAVLQLQKAREYAADLTKGFVSDLRSGLEQGKSFWSSFGNAALNVLDKITEKLLGDVINAMFRVNNASSGLGAVGGGNIFSTLIGGLFGGFRASGGPVSAGKAYVVGEKGPELMMPGQSGTVIPNNKLSAANNNGQVGGAINLSVHLTSDSDMFDAKVVQISGAVAGQQVKLSNQRFQSRAQTANDRGV